MSVSSTPEHTTLSAAKAALLAGVNEELIQAQIAVNRHAAILACAPDSALPSSINLFGYCAEQTMLFTLTGTFEEQRSRFSHLLACYPAVDLVDVSREAQKPRSMLRGHEHSAWKCLTPLAPVLAKTVYDKSKHLNCETPAFTLTYQWWTELAVGLTLITVNAEFSGLMDAPDALMYSPRTWNFAGWSGSVAGYARDYVGLSQKNRSASPARQLSEKVKAELVALVESRYPELPNAKRVQQAQIWKSRVLLHTASSGQPYSLEQLIEEDPAAQSSFTPDVLSEVHAYLVTLPDRFAQARADNAALGERVRTMLTGFLNGYSGIDSSEECHRMLRQLVALHFNCDENLGDLVLHRVEKTAGAKFKLDFHMMGAHRGQLLDDTYVCRTTVECNQDGPLLTEAVLYDLITAKAEEILATA